MPDFKMRIHICLFLGIAIASLSSCTKSSKEIVEKEAQVGDNFVLNITNDCFMQSVNISEIHSEIGKYAEMFRDSCETIGISSSRYYPLGEETVLAFYDPWDQIQTKGGTPGIDVGKIKINGHCLFTPATKAGSGNITALFGNSVTFNVSEFAPVTKSGNSDNIALYAPQIVRIEFPSVNNEDELFPLCYYQNFVVKWNKDTNNENGIAILIKWNGSMAYGEDYASSYVYHSICVPDNGIAELPTSMFTGIPDAAICELYVLRGDVESLEMNENNLRLLAESHDVLSFILVRNTEIKN